jgi:diadenosine tetraphosphate (Ap4A) HIT family hydrolase
VKGCELCTPAEVVFESQLAYVRHDSQPLGAGHLLIVPRRHVADYFAMTRFEQAAVQALLNRAHDFLQKKHSPDGYNIGVNIGKLAGQDRMHVHVHLIPRYAAGRASCSIAGAPDPAAPRR